jgi:hypothetical protein
MIERTNQPLTGIAMCMTDYLVERAREIEEEAMQRAALLDELTASICTVLARAQALPRAAGVVVMLQNMRDEVLAHRDAARHVVNDACTLRAIRQEVNCESART